MNNNKRSYVKWYVLGVIICIVTLSATIATSHINNMINRNIAATRLTDDCLRHGPIEFKGEVYFPSSYNLPEDKYTEVLGIIEPKDADVIVKYLNNDYALANKDDKNYTHFKTGGGHDSTEYTKAEFLENPDLVKEALQEYSRFVLCNDDSIKNIRIPIDREILIELENRFGKIDYKSEDFNNYDKLYYIYVDSPSGFTDSVDGKEILEVFDNPIVYMGCIFVRDDKFYYGNMNNNITGELADKLKNIIGI